jgi:hypothetical protein
MATSLVGEKVMHPRQSYAARSSLDQYARFPRCVDEGVSRDVGRNTAVQGLLACPFRGSVLIATSVTPMVVKQVKSLSSVGQVSYVAAYAGGNGYRLGKPRIVHGAARLELAELSQRASPGEVSSTGITLA